MSLPGYDAWKTRLPDHWDEDEIEDVCSACEGVGWLVCRDSGYVLIVACTECSDELEIEDLEFGD